MEGIGELKRVNISKSILNMSVDDKLCQAKNFSTQVESIPKTRLLLFVVSVLKANHQYKAITMARTTNFTGFKFIL